MWQDPSTLGNFWISILMVMWAVTVGYSGISALPAYLVLVGSRAELPCDLNVSSAEDEVSLVRWHRGDSSNPVYSVDARDMPLPSAKHFPVAEMATRAYFNSTVSPAILRLDGVKKEDQGVYRCTVEYRRARTETTDLRLTVIVPPREAIIMDEFGQHLHGVIGPYNEGYPLALICEGEGGDPSPAVTWWRGSELLDDTYAVTPQGFARNEMLLPSLQRNDLMTRLTCQVSNSNLTAPVTSSVILDMNLRPTDVRISSVYRPFSVGREAEVVCVARGARPPAQISWWLDSEQLTKVTESTAREDNLTVSTVTVTPAIDDDGRNLSCRADNPQLPESVLEDVWILTVHYLPRLTARLNNSDPVTEGNEVTITCEVHSNPPVSEVEWIQDGHPLTLPSNREQRNFSLVISPVMPGSKGHYQCAATNSEGRATSDTVLLRVHYAPKCQSVRSSVYGVGRTESVTVVCEVDAEPGDVNFSWMLNNSARAFPLSPSQFSSNGTKSVATVSPRSGQDYGVLHCLASNAVGRQREPCSFRIVPAGPPEEPRNCAATNRSVECVTLECEGGEDGGLQQLFQLEVFSPDSDRFLSNMTAHRAPTFTVCNLPAKESLIFVVYAINSKGKSKQVAIHTSTLSSAGTGNEGDNSGTINAILGVVVGAVVVLILLAVVIFIVIKVQARRAAKARVYRPDMDKCDAHLMKECKEPCVAGSQGPDIIPEKSFFQERSEPAPKASEPDEDTNPVTPKSDQGSRKYHEYQTVTYTEEPEFLSTPRKLRMLQEMEGEVEESGITVETPLISNMPPPVPQWTDHRKEGLRLSTPV